MATHDEDTKKTFRNSDVVCQVVPRLGGSEDSLFQV